MRWKHDRFGQIPPLLFIALAEESNLIHPLGLKAQEIAMWQLAKWKQQGIQGLRMSINLSPLQLQSTQFSLQMKEVLQQTGVQSNEIDLEITEGLELGTDPITNEVIQSLFELGFQFSIDDFGMGHTSLLYLRRFHFSEVKIDGSLIRDVNQDKHCQDLVSALMHLAISQNFTVVSEYIERKQQQEILNSLGCHECQGYLISRPLPADAC